MDLSEKQLIESVFAGGGDMGARMRAFDWSATDLGPVAQWPQSLRACVRIVLGAGHPMLISWGPNYTMLYNDAYGVVVGTKHPSGADDYLVKPRDRHEVETSCRDQDSAGSRGE